MGNKHLTISFEVFNTLYASLTGHSGACRWQYRLFTDIRSGGFPTPSQRIVCWRPSSITIPCGREFGQHSTLPYTSEF